MEFTIGDRVVCIDDKNQGNPSIIGYRDKLVRECYYWVRGFDFIGGGVLLEGITAGTYAKEGEEAGWKESRFRKVEEDIDLEFAENIIRELINKPINLN